MDIEHGPESAEPAEWHLDVQGRRIGPFTASQVVGLYNDGEILPEHRASTAPDDDASWITVEELARSFSAGLAQAEPGTAPLDVEEPQTVDPRTVEPAAPDAGKAKASTLRQGGAFRAPQRPRSLEPSKTALPAPSPPAPSPSDPSRELFATFQEAKERKQAKLVAPSTGNWGKREHRKLNLKPYLTKAGELMKKHRLPILAAAGVLAFAAAGFGVWALFVRSADNAVQGKAERASTRPARRTEAPSRPEPRETESYGEAEPAPRPSAPPKARKPYAGPGDRERIGGEDEEDEFEKEFGVPDLQDPDGSPIVTPRMRRLQKRLTELQKKGESLESLDDETVQMELMELEDEFQEEIESDFEAPQRDQESE